jgi:hypothetical protein
MFDTRNSPVRPPLRPAESEGPKPPAVSKASRHGRRVHSMNASPGSPAVSEAFAAAKETAFASCRRHPARIRTESYPRGSDEAVERVPGRNYYEENTGTPEETASDRRPYGL